MKKTAFITLAGAIMLLLTLVSPGAARELRRVELGFSRDLGITENVNLSGPFPSFSFAVPHYPGIHWEYSYLDLRVWFPDTVNPTDRLTVIMDNILVFSRSLERLPVRPGESGLVRIPLGGLTPTSSGPLLTIEVRGERVPALSPLPGEQRGTVWMVLEPQSTLYLYGSIRTAPPTVSHFFIWPAREIEIVLPEGEWTKNIQTASVEIVSSLRSALERWGTRVRLNALPLMSEEEKADPEAIRVYLRDPAPRDYHLLGNRLFLSPRGVQLACSPERDTMVGSSGNIDTLPLPSPPPSGSISIRHLTHEDIWLSSWEETTQTICFPASLFGGIPIHLALHLQWRLLSLSTESVFLVLINGHPVFSETLSPDDEKAPHLRHSVIDIPGHLIHGTNTVHFQLLESSSEQEAFPGTTASLFISADSLLRYRGNAPPPAILTFRGGGAFFWGRGTLVLPSQPTLSDLQAAAALFSSLPSGETPPADLRVISWEEFENTIDETPGMLEILIQRYIARPTSIWRIWEQLQKVHSDARRAYVQATEAHDGWEGTIRGGISAAAAFLYRYGEAISSFVLAPLQADTQDMSIPYSPEYFLAVFPPGDHPLTASVERTAQRPVTPDEAMGILTTSWYRGFPVLTFSDHGPRDLALRYFLEAIDKKMDVRHSESNTVLFSREGASAFTAALSPTLTRPPSWRDDLSEYRGTLLLIVFAFLVAAGIYFLSRLAHNWLRGG